MKTDGSILEGGNLMTVFETCPDCEGIGVYEGGEVCPLCEGLGVLRRSTDD